MKFTPRLKLVSIIIVLLVALPTGISLASVFSSQSIHEIVAYEEPAVRLSNYSINNHYGEDISVGSYNTSAEAIIQYKWPGPGQNNMFSQVNYSNAILLKSIKDSNMEANLTFRTLSGDYKYLANFSVYFVENNTFFKEVSLQSNNSAVTQKSPSLISVFNSSEPVEIGIMFQPALNKYTQMPGNIFEADIELNLNLFHVSGNNVDIYTQYSISIDLSLTT
jgi:hypothetical protein